MIQNIWIIFSTRIQDYVSPQPRIKPQQNLFKQTANAMLGQAKTKKEYKKLITEMLSSLDSESEDESLASSIKMVNLADDTTSVTINRSKKK
ncbi:hypothetical protein Gotur_019529 [Gossypium turneri]